MLDWKRLKATTRQNRLIIVCFHVLIAVKVASRFTSSDMPVWVSVVSWTGVLLPFAAGLVTAWLTYYYMFLSGEGVK